MAKLPILMYHNVSPTKSSGLTISKEKLEEQFKYLSRNNFDTFHLSQLSGNKVLRGNKVVLTFDDVTVNQLTYAYPLLKKYNLKATFFIPFGFIGKADSWNDGEEPIMNLKELKSLDSDIIELACHSFNHPKFDRLSFEEIEKDCIQVEEYLKQENLTVFKAIAYPYGKFPRRKEENIQFKELLKKYNYKYGLRIGNKLNNYPFNDNFEVKRIDIKGQDSLFKFKLKLKLGKTKLF